LGEELKMRVWERVRVRVNGFLKPLLRVSEAAESAQLAGKRRTRLQQLIKATPPANRDL
jgi:hypothetical protein